MFSDKGSHLHFAFALPGILYPEKTPSQIDYEDALTTFRINTLGPMLLMKHFSAFLPKKSADLSSVPQSDTLSSHATFAMMSARVGSITDNTRLGGWYSYRASKAAVNQLARTLDNQLRVASGKNAIAIAMHPGTVKTELSKAFWGTVEQGKLFEPSYSAERLLDVAAKMDVEKGRGRCWDWKGEEITP